MLHNGSKELGEYWREEALYGFSVVAVHLDEELEERDDVQPLVVVAERVLHRLESSEAAGVQEVALPSFGLQSAIPYENSPHNIHYVI